MDNEIIAKLEEAHYKSNEIEEKTGFVEQEINEMEKFEKAVSEIESSKENEILASIGKGVFIKSEIKERKLFIDVGKGIFVRKDISEAKEIVENQIKRLVEMKKELDNQSFLIENEMRRLIEEAEADK